MKKNLDQWNKIAGLIDQDKKRALAAFRIHEFVPGDLPVPPPMPAVRPWLPAVAASLIVAAALASFWLLIRSWQSTPAGLLPAAGLLDDSFLYARGGSPAAGNSAHAAPRLSSPLFTAWAAAGMTHFTTPAAGAAGPNAQVEHGDPEQVRRNIDRAIREGVLEQLLSHIREFHDKEA